MGTVVAPACILTLLFLTRLVFRRRRRRAAALAVLAELDRREPLPAPDEALAIGRLMALLDSQQVVDAEYSRVAPLYDKPTPPAPLI